MMFYINKYLFYLDIGAGIAVGAGALLVGGKKIITTFLIV